MLGRARFWLANISTSRKRVPVRKCASRHSGARPWASWVRAGHNRTRLRIRRIDRQTSERPWTAPSGRTSGRTACGRSCQPRAAHTATTLGTHPVPPHTQRRIPTGVRRAPHWHDCSAPARQPSRCRDGDGTTQANRTGACNRPATQPAAAAALLRDSCDMNTTRIRPRGRRW